MRQPHVDTDDPVKGLDRCRRIGAVIGQDRSIVVAGNGATQGDAFHRLDEAVFAAVSAAEAGTMLSICSC